MKYLSLIPTLWCFLCLSPEVFAAKIDLNIADKTDYFTVNVNISGLEKTSCKDKTCYLQGMFTSKEGSPKYFGLTFGQSDWFPYQSSPEKDFIKSNFIPFETSIEGSWSGIVRLQVDKEDTDFKGSGQYLIKVKRYTGESQSAATDDVNELVVNIEEEVTPAPTAESTPAPTSTNTPSPSPTNTPTPTPSRVTTPTSARTPTPTPSRINTPTPQLSAKTSTSPEEKINKIDDILGESTTSSEINLMISESSDTAIVKDIEPITTSKNTGIYKYMTISGIAMSALSAALLYIRSKRVKI